VEIAASDLKLQIESDLLRNVTDPCLFCKVGFVKA